MRLSRPLAGLAAAAVLATGALSGCGVSDAEIRPGVAADVDGAEISLDQVAEAVADTCEVLQGSPELLQGGFTGAELRGIVVQQLVVTEVATAIAEENGLDADVLRREAERQARNSFGFTAEDSDDASIPVFAASSFLTSVISEVVDPTLSEEELVEPGPAYQAFLEQWQAENDIDVNPLFDQVDFAEAASGALLSDTSVAVSEAATLRAQADELRNRAAQGDPAAQAELTTLVSSLPQSQACAAEEDAPEPAQAPPIPLENPNGGQG
ncbi:hypothetical protein [Nocardioides sp.]|uniref:hypothetical protein n=1 Tax=Nocardioides sp. TaxID=35761 RepID=UPI00260FA50F|nr:hypothetical protein [Nocardioides sp.]